MVESSRKTRTSETAFYHTHVAGAISELRRALAHPGYMSITAIMRTVLNLGWAAVGLPELARCLKFLLT